MNIIIIGVGEIAKKLLEGARYKKNIKIKGAVDIDENKKGKTITEVTGITGYENIVIEKDIEKVIKKDEDYIIIHLTRSHIPDIKEDLLKVIEYGFPIITTSEEMTDPYLKYPEIAEEIDKKCKEKNVTLLPTGINPGFLMDFLPVFFSSVFRKIEKIEVIRINNASKRRYPLQKKIGSGLSREEFYEKWKKGEMGHVGLAESGSIIAKTLGLRIKELEETCDPKIAKENIKTEFFDVKPGECCGILHRVNIKTEENIEINLFLEMSLDAENTRDEVTVIGEPPLSIRIEGSTPGDEATANVVLNWVNKVKRLPAGLITIDKLPIPSYWI